MKHFYVCDQCGSSRKTDDRNHSLGFVHNGEVFIRCMGTYQPAFLLEDLLNMIDNEINLLGEGVTVNGVQQTKENYPTIVCMFERLQQVLKRTVNQAS